MININGKTYILHTPESWDTPCMKVSSTQCHLAIMIGDNINIILVDTSMTYNGFTFENADEIKLYIDSL